MLPKTKPASYAYYTTADHRHFLGLVALINSIRIVDPEGRIIVVDAGLRTDQSAFVAQEAELVTPPPGLPLVALRPEGPLARPSDAAILLDADVLVLKNPADLLRSARGGKIVAFVDGEPHTFRHFPEWEELLGLPPLRRQAYCNAGQLIVPSSKWSVLELWQRHLAQVDSARTWLSGRDLEYPFYFGDQDVFNAIAASYLSADDFSILDHRLAPHPPFPELELVDVTQLRCRYADGIEPHFLHHTLAKPWLAATPRTVYSRLMTRLLLGEDVALHPEVRQVPRRLRRGPVAAVDRGRASIQAKVASTVRRNLGRFGIRTRLRAWRARQADGE